VTSPWQEGEDLKAKNPENQKFNDSKKKQKKPKYCKDSEVTSHCQGGKTKKQKNRKPLKFKKKKSKQHQNIKIQKNAKKIHVPRSRRSKEQSPLPQLAISLAKIPK
jgi:hypothetical protein